MYAGEARAGKRRTGKPEVRQIRRINSAEMQAQTKYKYCSRGFQKIIVETLGFNEKPGFKIE